MALIIIVILHKQINEADENAQATESLFFSVCFFSSSAQLSIFPHEMKKKCRLLLGITSENTLCHHRKHKCAKSKPQFPVNQKNPGDESKTEMEENPSVTVVTDICGMKDSELY